MADPPVKSEIGSFDDLHTAFKTAEDAFGRRPWFRGQRDGEWQLVPTVFRLAKERDTDSPLFESTMMTKWKARARLRYPECPRDEAYFDWLSLMQHFRLPTRLLDWTESILVAAYFAVTGKSKPNPSAIRALDPYRLNLLHPELGGAPFSPSEDPIMALAEDAFTGRSRWSLALAVISPETNLRMLVQHAVFTIHGNRKPLEQRDDAAEYLMKFPIAESFRSTLKGMLRSFNIHDPALFPDLEQLSAGIAEFERPPARQTRPTA